MFGNEKLFGFSKEVVKHICKHLKNTHTLLIHILWARSGSKEKKTFSQSFSVLFKSALITLVKIFNL